MDQNNIQCPRKRRKVLWILLSILAILLIAAVVLGIMQKNNIDAVTQFNKYTQEELEEQLKQNDQYVKDLLDAALNAAGQVDQNTKPNASPTPVVTAVSTTATTTAAPQTTAATAAATTRTPSSTTASGTAKATTAAPSLSTTAAATTAPRTTAATTKVQPDGPTYEQQLKAIVDKVYALRQEYLTALDSLQAEAIAEYKTLSAGQKTTKALMSFVSKFVSKGTALERECDKKMDALISELTALQKKYDQSLELVDAVKYTYAQEKSLKKAWYMSELESRGLI